MPAHPAHPAAGKAVRWWVTGRWVGAGAAQWHTNRNGQRGRRVRGRWGRRKGGPAMATTRGTVGQSINVVTCSGVCAYESTVYGVTCGTRRVLRCGNNVGRWQCVIRVKAWVYVGVKVVTGSGVWYTQ